MEDGTQSSDATGEYSNWRYDGYYQTFVYIPLTYTAPVAPSTNELTLLTMGVGV